MNALGNHVIAEFYDCDELIINNQEIVQGIMIDAVEVSGATIIKPFFHKFNPHGVSGVVVVAESHFSIHTWPEYKYCAIDIFTCGDLIDNHKALQFLKQKFKAKNISVVEMKRGLLDIGVELLHKPIYA